MRGDSKVQGQRRFTGATFLRNEGERVHRVDLLTE
jgi:hypothetical protein